MRFLPRERQVIYTRHFNWADDAVAGIWELMWHATKRIPAKGWHKTHMGQLEWQNWKSKAQQVPPVLIPELLWPTTVRYVLFCSSTAMDKTCRNVSNSCGRKFQKKITPFWKGFPARPFWFKHRSSCLGELPLELHCRPSKIVIPTCHMLCIWDRQGKKVVIRRRYPGSS